MLKKHRIAFYDAKSYDRISFQQSLLKKNLGDCFEFLFLELQLTKESVAFASGCDAICAFVNDDLSADVIAEIDAENIRLVVMRCAGFDRVDLVACNELGISVARVPAYSPYAVAEFAASLLFTLNRKTHRAYNRVRDGNFTLSGLVGFDLHGKTVGVVGTGKIGHCFINIAIGLGCKVLAFDVFINQQVAALPQVKYVSLDELYVNSDVISLHAPLTKETTHMINNAAINKMKTGVVILNTSRGALIDSHALVTGLIAGKIGGAGLDVYENEGKFFFRDVSDIEIDDEILARLQNMRNVLITSHQAFLTAEALEAISNTTLFNLSEYFLENKSLNQLTNHVQPPETPLTKALSRRASMAAEESDDK